MDPDVEFNALAAVYQSVIQDIKHSYPAWEVVAQRALKLSQQLKSTVQCLTSFVDSMQAVSDYANNLKGASRDVGACVTRICMRERAIETRLRSVADALSEELAVAIQQRTGYWKHRTQELDKLASKHVKKVRGRKGRPDEASLSEQRHLCAQVLTEQRAQFSFFISSLMPFLNAQLSAFDEGPHIRQVVETLEDTIKGVDGKMLAENMVSDISQGADNTFRQCLSSAANSSYLNLDDSISLRAGTPGSTFSNDDDMTPQGARPRTISVGPRYDHPTINSQTYMPLSKPPLQRRPSEKSLIKTSSTPPPEPGPPSAYRTCSSDLSPTTLGRVPRPQSFTGELRAAYNYHHPSTFGIHQYPPLVSSSCSSSDASSALIAETLQQIDQLGSDLDNYCVAADNKSFSNLNQFSSMSTRPNGLEKSASSAIVGSVRMRSESASRPPPPPTRRSSTITAATPTAPSVAEARLSMGSMMGSRQSLNSSGVFCSMGSASDLRYANVNPYVRQSSVQPQFKI